jgi:hypothetical protein
MIVTQCWQTGWQGVGACNPAVRALAWLRPSIPASRPSVCAGGYGHNGRYALAHCEVARAADFGSNDQVGA